MKKMGEKVPEDTAEEVEPTEKKVQAIVWTKPANPFSENKYYECEICGYVLRVAQDVVPGTCPLCHAEGTFEFQCNELEYQISGGILPKNKYAESYLFDKIVEHPGLTAEELKAELENKEKVRELLLECDDEELYFDMLKNEAYFFLWPPKKLQRALDHLLLTKEILYEVGADRLKRYYWRGYKKRKAKNFI